MVLHVLTKDRCLDVRRNAALNLLHCIQDRPPRSVALSLSMSEILQSIGWEDENALTLPPRKRYQRDYKFFVKKGPKYMYHKALRSLWDFMTSDPSCDHCVRILLLNMWTYVFESGSIPDALKDGRYLKILSFAPVF